MPDLWLRMTKNILLVILSIIIVCVVGEAAVRWLLPKWAPDAARVTKFWQYDPRYGWVHVPNARGKFSSFGFDATVTINWKGFRGPPLPYERTRNVSRIVLLGDSFAWGYGVNYSDTFAARLEQDLSHVEVVNLAVSGYSTDQQLLLYIDEGRRYKPDLVLVQVAANDITYNAETLAYTIYGKPAFTAKDGGLVVINQPVAKTPWIKQAVVRIAWRSYVLNQFFRYLQTFSQPGGQNVLLHDGTPNITARLLLALREETEKDGADLLVVFVEDVTDGPLFATFLQQHNVEHVLLGQYLTHDDRSLHLRDGRHWNAAGHAIVARVLANRLRSSGRMGSGLATPHGQKQGEVLNREFVNRV